MDWLTNVRKKSFKKIKKKKLSKTTTKSPIKSSSTWKKTATKELKTTKSENLRVALAYKQLAVTSLS